MKALLNILGLCLIGCIAGLGFGNCGGAREAAEQSPAIVNSLGKVLLPAPAFAQGEATAIADIAERSVASVVNIASTKVIHLEQHMSPFFSDPFFRQFFGGSRLQGPFRQMPAEQRQKSLGSGVIVSKDGTILTNNHVVEKADEIMVTLSDGREFEAKVVGTDPKSDLAIVKLKEAPGDLKPLGFGKSDRLRLGDVVLAIGNPFGVGQTVTMGIVSAKGRSNMGIVDYEDFIQTDAAINPGNSGGALISLEGKLVGINTAILSRSGGYQGIGFAIPSNMVQDIMESLLKHGKVVRGWLGVAIQDIDQHLAEALDLEDTKGVLVSDVTEGSPAEKAGLERSDVILKVNEEAVDSTGRLRNIIASKGADAEVTLDIMRDGKAKQVVASLGELPANLGGTTEIPDDQGVLGGLKLGTLNPAHRDKYDLPKRLTKGVVVIEVNPDSHAQRAGFHPGDVILEVNRRPVNSIDQVSQSYRAAHHRVLLLVYRNGSTFFLVLQKEAK
ncbi:DegQ family serine endoprotease [Myxococcota bacterium]